MTKSILASQRRCSSRLMSITDPPAGVFHLKRQIEGCLMIKRALLVGIAQALVDQPQVEACALGLFNWI